MVNSTPPPPKPFLGKQGRQLAKADGNFDRIYEHTDPWGVAKHAYRLMLTANFLTGTEKNILDLGCGEGKLFEYVRELNKSAKLTGVDISSKAIARAKASFPKDKFEIADITKLPFFDSAFDFIFCTEVLYYLENVEEGLKEIYRVMGRNAKGVIGLTLGNHYFDYNEILSKMRKYFTLGEEKIILPKPIPNENKILGKLLLPLYKIFPSRMPIKVYISICKT